MVTSLVGENSYALQAHLKTRVDSFLSEFDEFGLQKIDGTEASFEQIQEAIYSLPFLASKKLVIVNQPSFNKQFLENFEELFSDIPEIIDVVIVEQAIDKRTSYYKWLKKSTDFYEFKTPSENELASWAVDYALQQNAKLSLADARYLVQRTLTSQEGLVGEIEKLSLYSNKIDKSTIDTLTEQAPASKIFDLLDAAFAGNHKRAIKLYNEQRMMKVQPQEIIAMIGWQLRIVALAKTANKHDLVRDGKISPYTAEKAKRIAGRINYEQIKKLVRELVDIDTKSKRQPIDLDEALQNYLINL